MSNYNYEGYSDGDFDDREELIWSEADWQRFLGRNRREIESFIALYREFRLMNSKSLEEIAKKMGWIPDEDGFLDIDLGSIDFGDPDNEDASNPGPDAFTIHNHPVYIVSKGIYSFIANIWEEFLVKNPNACSAIISWRFADSIKRGEDNALQAIYSIEIGEYALAACHFKHALASLNDTLMALQQTPKRDQGNNLLKIIQSSCFDLREAWLKCLQDCRDASSPTGEL